MIEPDETRPDSLLDGPTTWADVAGLVAVLAFAGLVLWVCCGGGR